MNDRRTTTRPVGRFVVAGVALASVVLGLAASGGVAAASAAAKPKPHIVATPNNVMVNSTVKLVGTHFPANATIVLRECGKSTWIAPQNPCDKKKITVSTNKHGRFTDSISMGLCPRSPWPGHPVNELRCYIGEVQPTGVDVIDLVGHVRVIVTYP
jgi:hypothetical protein